MLVDGAHAVGARHLDVPSLGAHYYTSNLHKWLCTPKGSAFLWVTPAEQPHTLPLVTSHGYGLVNAFPFHFLSSKCSFLPLKMLARTTLLSEGLDMRLLFRQNISQHL